MRSIFLTILFLSLSVHMAFADCASSGVYVYPEAGDIYQNNLIFIEGYANSNETVMEFGKKYTLKLVSENDEVELKRLEHYIGMMHLKKVVFTPSRLLKMNETYKLVVEGLDQNHHDYPTYWDAESRTSKYFRYKVTKAADYSAPTWSNTPTHKENSQTFFGCGPAIYAIFNTDVATASYIMVKVTLKNESSGESNTYVLPLKGEKTLLIGHGMCSGAFSFTYGDNYKIRFKLYDNCGNTNDKWTDWISFKNPAPEVGR